MTVASPLRRVLYICDKNAVRSPMSEMLTKHLTTADVFVDSVGLEAGEVDHFVYAVLQEHSIPFERHGSKTLADVDVPSFDLIVALTCAAYDQAQRVVVGHPCRLEYWEVTDPTLVVGHREMRLQAYRALCDELDARIRSTLSQMRLDLLPK